MIQVNRIYLIFNRLVTKKFLVDTSEIRNEKIIFANTINTLKNFLLEHGTSKSIHFST